MKFLKQNWLTLSIISLGISFAQRASAFIQAGDYSSSDPAGFFAGIWHGLLAPWSLIARWLIENVSMYATANTGWWYDLGFLLGVGCSMPIGWIAAIVSTISHLLA